MKKIIISSVINSLLAIVIIGSLDIYLMRTPSKIDILYIVIIYIALEVNRIRVPSYQGKMIVDSSDPTKDLYSLALDIPLDNIKAGGKLCFKIVDGHVYNDKNIKK